MRRKIIAAIIAGLAILGAGAATAATAGAPAVGATHYFGKLRMRMNTWPLG